ncbi:MAG: hypothetical protein HY209_01630 [Candidatus Omnitrophica bacterium]|nr:hypothetical protein [Candidatus Omnitrophota bacterium]
MKTIYVLWWVMVFGVYSSLVGAAPASNIQLSYDTDKQTLHVEADHPTDRLDRYFIRRVVVTKNPQESQEFYFSRQTSPAKFIADLDYPANPGDHLEVQLFASEGGTTQGSLDVIKAEQAKDGDEKKTVPDRW